jgi:hypothetical protein
VRPPSRLTSTPVLPEPAAPPPPIMVPAKRSRTPSSTSSRPSPPTRPHEPDAGAEKLREQDRARLDGLPRHRHGAPQALRRPRPEADYKELATLDGCVAYLARSSRARPRRSPRARREARGTPLRRGRDRGRHERPRGGDPSWRSSTARSCCSRSTRSGAG